MSTASPSAPTFQGSAKISPLLWYLPRTHLTYLPTPTPAPENTAGIPFNEGFTSWLAFCCPQPHHGRQVPGRQGHAWLVFVHLAWGLHRIGAQLRWVNAHWMSEGALACKVTDFFEYGLNALGFIDLKTFYFSECKSLASDYKFLVDLKASCTFCSTEYRIWTGRAKGPSEICWSCVVTLKTKKLKLRGEGLARAAQLPAASGFTQAVSASGVWRCRIRVSQSNRLLTSSWAEENYSMTTSK